MGAYAPAGGLRGTPRGALALVTGCLAPPPDVAAAVTLALTPRASKGPLTSGLGWVRSPVGRDAVAWWHNGATHGSTAFVGFDPDRGVGAAAVATSARSCDAAGREALLAS